MLGYLYRVPWHPARLVGIYFQSTEYWHIVLMAMLNMNLVPAIGAAIRNKFGATSSVVHDAELLEQLRRSFEKCRSTTTKHIFK